MIMEQLRYQVYTALSDEAGENALILYCLIHDYRMETEREYATMHPPHGMHCAPNSRWVQEQNAKFDALEAVN